MQPPHDYPRSRYAPGVIAENAVGNVAEKAVDEVIASTV